MVISFIGYEKKEVVVKSEYIDIALTPDQKALEEVVVVGYASQRKISTVGAISVADVADVKVSNYNPPSSFMPVMIKRVQPDAEEYGSYKENRFLGQEQALSTFSLDVDAASYGNMRRMINMGQKPPNAIRVEELINYFSYDYPKPTGKDPVSINTETSICPWDATHRLVKIGVKSPRDSIRQSSCL